MTESIKSLVTAARRRPERTAEEEIRKLAIERIEYYEKKLRNDYGIVVKCAAEIKSLTTDQNNKPILLSLSEAERELLCNSRMLHAHLLGGPGKYEVSFQDHAVAKTVQGAEKDFIHISKRNSCLVTARTIDGLR